MWMRAGAHARALSLVARVGERHSRWPTRLARPRAGSEAAAAAAAAAVATPGREENSIIFDPWSSESAEPRARR